MTYYFSFCNSDKPLSQNAENSNDSKSSDQKDQDSSSNSKGQDSNENEARADSISICSDTSVAVIDNIYAYDLDEDWLSDEGFNETTLNESSLQPKSVIPKSVMNPALAYMLENSGLNKEQILKIVEQSKKNKMKSDTTGSQGSTKRKKNPRRSVQIRGKRKKLFLDSTTESPKVKEEPLEEPDALDIVESSSESTDFNKVSQEPKVLNFIQSGSESDDFVEVPVKITDSKSGEKNGDPDKTVTMESSDSESDDFVEVENAPIPKQLSTTDVKKHQFEITVKTDENLEDDIFADVFTDVEAIKKLDHLTENKPTGSDIKIPEDIGFIESSDEEDFVEVQEEKSLLLEEKKDDCAVPSSSKNGSPEDNEVFLMKTPVKENQDETKIANIPQETISNKSSKENEVQIVNSEVVDNITEKNNQNIVEDNILDDLDNFFDTSDEEGKHDNDQQVIDIEKEPPIVLPVDEKELESMKVLFYNSLKNLIYSV